MLNIESITHVYRNSLSDQKIVDDVSFALAAGEQLLLRGISGSGKTTLINIIAGLLTPTGGTVTLDGQSVYALAEAARDGWRRAQIGYVFQTHHLLPLLNAWENVALPLAVGGVGRAARRKQAVALLEQVGLGEHVGFRPKQLSTGQRQRVAIARALINQPKLILADEPTASLDSEAAGVVLDLLQARCREQQTMLIVASHDPALNARFDRVADIKYGHWSEKIRKVDA